MRKTKLIILFLLFTAKLYSQAENKEALRIAYEENDSIEKVQLIPLNALNGDYDVLLLSFDYDTIKVIEKKTIEISWPSHNIDGRYDLVITPKQIYLKSSHENPNPNFLYWITSINREQFELIKKYLNKEKNEKLLDCTSEYSSRQSFFFDGYKKEKYVNNDWTDKQYLNFSRIMDLINRPLKEKNNWINIPDIKSFERISPIRIAGGLNEIENPLTIIKIE